MATRRYSVWGILVLAIGLTVPVGARAQPSAPAPLPSQPFGMPSETWMFSTMPQQPLAEAPPGPFEMPNWAPPEPATAQLPPPSSGGPGLFSYPPALEPGPPPGELLLEGPDGELFSAVDPNRPRGKPGMLQWAMARWTWLPAFGSQSMGMHDATAQAILAVPPFINGTPLLVSPYFTAHFIDGPKSIDLPARIYESALELRWMNEVTDTVSVDLAVAPGLYGDYVNNGSDAFRITGRAIALLRWTPTLQVVSGVIYLDRDDISILPGAGVIWTPTEDHKFELVFPRPRIARRVLVRELSEDWLYLAGEFGGNSWAIRRTSGLDDVVTYSDLRAVLGWERRSDGRVGGRVELGYVFRRELDYRSGEKLNLDGTMMVRSELSY